MTDILPEIPDILRQHLGDELAEIYRLTPLPPRAWALARAMHECAREASNKEQKAVMDAFCATDPEPEPEIPDAAPITDEILQQWRTAWDAWHERVQAAGAYAKCDAIVARHKVHYLRDLEHLAEENMVDWVRDQMATRFPDRFASIAKAFDSYKEGLLYGELLNRFLTICFNCPTENS